MPIPAEHAQRYVYHFTFVENLKDILKHGLLSPNQKKAHGLDHVDIAEGSIQCRRAEMDVSCAPGGKVHDYVPFYFCKRTSMLQAVICKKNIDQQFLVYIAVPVTLLNNADVIFSSASANTDPAPSFHNDPQLLTDLRWDLIDNMHWRWSDSEKKLRMAEMLVKDRVDVASFARIFTWNNEVSAYVGEIYAEKNLVAPPMQATTRYYYTQYPEHREWSLITGPYFLRKQSRELVAEITGLRAAESMEIPICNDIDEALAQISAEFCTFQALEAVEGLETANEIHRETVGAHTRTVVQRLKKLDLFDSFEEREKKVLELGAYLHDTGKSESPRNPQGQQRADLDHPAKAMPWLKQVLAYDIKVLADEDIRQIVMLVVYHDLIGDVVDKGRDRDQILEVVQSPTDFDMISALSLADVSSLSPENDFEAYAYPIQKGWLDKIRAELPALRAWVVEQLASAGSGE